MFDVWSLLCLNAMCITLGHIPRQPSSIGQANQDRSFLEEAIEVSKENRRRSCRANARFVSMRLAEAEGRKGAAARGEGRSPVVATKSSNEAASRPSGQRATAPFQAAERRSASRQRFVVRAGRRIRAD